MSRTTPDVVQTATMLIRFCVAIDLIDVAGAERVVNFLRLAFCDVALAAIAFPKNGGSGALSRPDPDALPVEVLSPICSHHVMGSAVKA